VPIHYSSRLSKQATNSCGEGFCHTWIINTNENSRNLYTIVSTCGEVYEAYSAVSSLLYTALLAVTSTNDNLPEMRDSLNVSPRKEVKTCWKQCQRAVCGQECEIRVR